jgi:hypothetical protein
MAEALWTGAENRDYSEFLIRLERHGPVLAHLGAESGPAARPLQFTGGRNPSGPGFRIGARLDPRVTEALAGRNLVVRYRLVDSPSPSAFRPDRLPEEQNLPAVTADDGIAPPDPWAFEGETGNRSWVAVAALFVDGRPYGAPALLEFRDHLAIGADLVFGHEPSERYPGDGPRALVDGLHGSRFFEDGFWTGFEGRDLDVTLDLGSVREIREVSIRFLQDANAWIFLPRKVRCYGSIDGNNWFQAGAVTHQVPDRRQDKLIHEFDLELPSSGTRFVRVHGISPRVCPDWHPGRDEPCWIFADEIVCR